MTNYPPKMSSVLNEQDFHGLMAQAPVALSVLRGDDLIIESANAIMLQVWGKNNSIIGHPLVYGLPELVGQPFVDILHNVINTGIAHHGYEAKVALVRNGLTEKCYFNFVYQPIAEPDGKVSGVMVVATEVTEQINVRLKLQDAEERLRLAAEATGLGTFDLDLQSGGIIHSPKLAEIFGHNSPTIVGHQELRDIVHPADLHIVIKAFDKALHSSIYFYEVRIIWPDGTIRWIRTTGKVVYDENSLPLRMLGTVQDITDQRHIMEALKKGEEDLRLATQAAELGTFDMDPITRKLVWDKRCGELFGITKDGPINYDETFLLGLHPDDREKTDYAVNRAFNRELSNGEYDVEYRTIGIEDKKLRWIRAKGKVLFNDQDMPVRFTGAVLDITENKRNELRKNDFIAMASHELKTPLTSLKAYIQLLIANAKRSGDSFLLNALEKSENQINKMTRLIYGFLDLSKLESGKLQLNPEIFDLNQLIEEMVADSLPIAQGHGIVFNPAEAINVTADREKIGQVLSNFINNAIKYSPKGTDVTIECKLTGKMVKINVTDKGIGIKLKDQQNIFQRFYRVEDESTKGFSGFGIGLYLSAEIIALHNGKIGVDSTEGQGASFYFSLPL
ncbi:PAS domain S-box protein [Inquilinus sp. KBS0705]|nr:PAS domain S-box protein [Inquilinus sp. KBS0705]